MKKSIPFDLFGPNQFLMFDLGRLAKLERAMGCTITELVTRQNAGVDFCLNALPIAMEQHYYRPSPAFFEAKIEAHLDNGGNLDEIAVPLVKAVLASGIFGKEAIDRVSEAEAGTKAEPEAEDGEEGKNGKEGTV